MTENTLASSSPTTLSPTVLTYSSAGLLRLSQDDIQQIATAVADFIRPLSIPGTELLTLSSSNPLQVLGSLLSSKESSSSLVSTPAFFNNASIMPMYEICDRDIRYVCKTYRIERMVYNSHDP